MIRRFYFIIIILLTFVAIQPVFTRPMYDTQELSSVNMDVLSEEEIIDSIRNNQYLLESIRLTQLAGESFENAEYDASITYANEAIHYTILSDAFVAIAVAQYRIYSVDSSELSDTYQEEINEAQNLLNASINAWEAEEWEEAKTLAQQSAELLAHISVPGGTITLPATYMVRSWVLYGDSFWDIAGRPWVYGNPRMWRILYNANRSKLPNPNNPNLIRPGMIMDIPSIRGETREGAWNANATYPALE